MPLSQEAAYDVLVEMSSRSLDSLKLVTSKLIDWHHKSVDTTEWEYMPPVEGRASSGKGSSLTSQMCVFHIPVRFCCFTYV